MLFEILAKFSSCQFAIDSMNDFIIKLKSFYFFPSDKTSHETQINPTFNGMKWIEMSEIVIIFTVDVLHVQWTLFMVSSACLQLREKMIFLVLETEKSCSQLAFAWILNRKSPFSLIGLRQAQKSICVYFQLDNMYIYIFM